VQQIKKIIISQYLQNKERSVRLFVCLSVCLSGFQPGEDLGGIKVVVTWVHLYQWGDIVNALG